MPSGLDQLAQLSAPAPLSDAVALSRFLDLLPDPRGLRGRRYLLSALVAAAAASVLAGACSLAAITEWIADAPAWACQALGFPVDPLTGVATVPHPQTRRRLLVQLDGDALDQAIGAFPAARAAPAPSGLRAIAVAGKVLRGSRTATAPAVTLLAAMDPQQQVRLGSAFHAQWLVPSRGRLGAPRKCPSAREAPPDHLRPRLPPPVMPVGSSSAWTSLRPPLREGNGTPPRRGPDNNKAPGHRPGAFSWSG
ncbi:transposase family protein [Streptomyces sp. SID11385]|uniref:transposase family protein n=1 Tax=Streptomyces sp. SID11385 TaxID=2706031 RepID=UPI001EF32286|nr:transposase family protein [Streptomyces sp. SID11385]